MRIWLICRADDLQFVILLQHEWSVEDELQIGNPAVAVPDVNERLYLWEWQPD
jgi:hypothetical protein